MNAEGQVPGPLVTRIATELMGKHGRAHTQHVDSGDYVITANAENIWLTGRKAEQKMKLRSSGCPAASGPSRTSTGIRLASGIHGCPARSLHRPSKSTPRHR